MTDRCRSLVRIFRVGPVAAGAKASALCEGSMPDNSERQIQIRFKFVSQSTSPHKKLKNQIHFFARGPWGNVNLDSHMSVTDRCRSLVDMFTGGQGLAEAMVSSLCESRMPQCTKRLIQGCFKVCAP